MKPAGRVELEADLEDAAGLDCGPVDGADRDDRPIDEALVRVEIGGDHVLLRPSRDLLGHPGSGSFGTVHLDLGEVRSCGLLDELQAVARDGLELWPLGDDAGEEWELVGVCP
jgi:hypothetical protein